MNKIYIDCDCGVPQLACTLCGSCDPGGVGGLGGSASYARVERLASGPIGFRGEAPGFAGMGRSCCGSCYARRWPGVVARTQRPGRGFCFSRPEPGGPLAGYHGWGDSSNGTGLGPVETAVVSGRP